MKQQGLGLGLKPKGTWTAAVKRDLLVVTLNKEGKQSSLKEKKKFMYLTYPNNSSKMAFCWQGKK